MNEIANRIIARNERKRLNKGGFAPATAFQVYLKDSTLVWSDAPDDEHIEGSTFRKDEDGQPLESGSYLTVDIQRLVIGPNGICTLYAYDPMLSAMARMIIR